MVGYVGFGNDELALLPKVKWGDLFICPRCGAAHQLTNNEAAGSATRELLLWYVCADGKDYLGAVAGRLVVNARPTVRGEL